MLGKLYKGELLSIAFVESPMTTPPFFFSFAELKGLENFQKGKFT